MSARAAEPVRPRAPRSVPTRSRWATISHGVVAGSLYVAVMVVLAAVAAWPIYRGWSFIVLVSAAVAVATAIAGVAHWRRWNGWVVAGILAVALFVLGVAFAVPSRIAEGLPGVLRGFADVATGVVLGFKDLLTVDLPVGAYRNLLVPALVVFLVGTCGALLLAWRAGRLAYAAVAVAIGMLSFGLFFGRTSVSAPVSWGPFTLAAPVETALGVGGLVASVLWLAWRTREERVRALQRATASSGVRLSRRPSQTDRRRRALGAGMVAVAVVTAVAIVPAVAADRERDVLRATAGPEIEMSRAVSPLAAYRGLFALDRSDDVLFTVTTGEDAPERVRIATLDGYDGETYRSGASGAGVASRFVRVPSTLDAGDGREVEATVSIDQLTGIWMPTAGSLSQVSFSGGRAAALSDGFYYSVDAEAGVQIARGGLRAGDEYVLRGVEAEPVELATIAAPGGAATRSAVSIPPNLEAWIDEHRTGSGGAALDGLVSLLRERGYLSHALAITPEEPPAWMASLADYSFQPSAAGHSLARIDTLFGRLLERENDPRAEASGNYVAAIGDDEQFAVAVSLIAQQLGFPSRVVLGARLESAEPGLASCDAGVCRAQDLTVWTEVLADDGAWVPVDVTPQYAASPSLDLSEQRDPENVTEVLPDTISEVVPPDPVQEDVAPNDDTADESGLDLAWLWPLLRVAAIAVLVLLILCGPFLVVVAAKAARRRARRREGHPATRIAGGWDEYVDAAVDTGRSHPWALTRTELALAYAVPARDAEVASPESEGGRMLADQADRASFSAEDTTASDADAFWQIVDAERARFAREGGVWHRLRSAVSLRSFLRLLTPSRAGAGRPSSSRGGGIASRDAGRSK
ncbi:DUF3488 and transglutaminase-like domain-containing protein [Microbacterium lacus]|uniref:transglutaminaseTgpA domain-containing protein n=1 Tax=Microbacterium lacus TaxID=415217 RepID=UPI00384B87D3